MADTQIPLTSEDDLDVLALSVAVPPGADPDWRRTATLALRLIETVRSFWRERDEARELFTGARPVAEIPIVSPWGRDARILSAQRRVRLDELRAVAIDAGKFLLHHTEPDHDASCDRCTLAERIVRALEATR